MEVYFVRFSKNEQFVSYSVLKMPYIQNFYEDDDIYSAIFIYDDNTDSLTLMYLFTKLRRTFVTRAQFFFINILKIQKVLYFFYTERSTNLNASFLTKRR